MINPVFPRWLSALSAFVLLLATSQARGAGTILSVELTGPRDDLPGWVCLVNEKPKGYITQPSEVELETRDVKPLGELWAESNEDFKAALASQGVSDACVLPDGSCSAAYGDIQDGRAKLKKAASPADEKLKKWLMRCSQNDEVQSQRVAVLRLDQSGLTPVDVIAFTAHGRTLRISISSDIDVMLSATLIGGHYQAGTSGSAHPKFEVLQLALEPRCVARPIPAVPAPATLQRKYYLGKDGKDVKLECQGKKALLLPRTIDASPKVLKVHATTGSQGTQAEGTQVVAAFRGEWTSVYPPDALRMVVTAIQFIHRLPCEFPGDSCPVVNVPGTSMSCETVPPAEVRDGKQEEPTKKQTLCSAMPAEQSCKRADLDDVFACRYRCTYQEEAGGISLPAALSFEGGKQSVPWTAQLTYAEQIVRSNYVPTELRRFLLDLKDVPPHPDNGDEIDAVELTTPNGQRIVTQVPAPVDREYPRPLVTLPNTTCKQTVAVRYLGRRPYEPKLIEVFDGALVLPKPSDASKNWFFGLRLGGGFFIAPHDEVQNRPYGEVSAAIRLRPPADDYSFVMPSAFGFEVTYLVSTQPYLAARDPNDRSALKASEVGYNRFLFDLLLSYAVIRDVEASVGGGIGFGYPLEETNEQRVGRATFIWNLRACAGWTPSERIVFELCGRYLPAQPYPRFKADDDLFASPEPTADSVRFWGLGLGLRGWL